jgi:hypothetical protein
VIANVTSMMQESINKWNAEDLPPT